MNYDVFITAHGFSLSVLRLNSGSATVTFINQTHQNRSAVADGGEFNSGTIAPGGGRAVVPVGGLTTCLHPYHDGFFPNFKATIIKES
jgi:hypothetical protein